MVAAVMLDAKMPISGHRKRYFSERFFDRGIFMTQFVRGVDAQAAVAAGDNCTGKDRPERQSVCCSLCCSMLSKQLLLGRRGLFALLP